MATLDVTKETARVDAGKTTLTAAAADYDLGVRGLLAADGKTPIFAQPEHDAKMAALLSRLADRVAGVDELADGVLANVESARLNQHADPLMALNLAELSLANQYAQFVREDCQALPVAQLAGRLEWAAQSRDAGLRYVYGKYGAQRFAALLAMNPPPAGVPEVRTALERLGVLGSSRGLSPDAEKLRFAAEALKRAAARQIALSRDPAKFAADKEQFARSVRNMF